MFRKRPPSVAKSDVAPGASEPSKRQFFRASVALPTQYELVGRSGARTGTIKDMSGGGVRLVTEEDIQPGTVVEVRFTLGGDSAPRRARGRIVLSFFDASEKKYGHGVAFTGIDRGDQEAIVQYITELQRQKLRGRTV
jgi:c-di-GMP-binding flagellar brake protein YcgR